MSDINITKGYYHYIVEFNDVDFKIDVELYLNSPNIVEAIAEAFDGDFIEVSELSTVTCIEITNYCGEMCTGVSV